MRRLGKWLGWVLVSAMAIWPLAAWWVERAPVDSPTPTLPTCGAFVVPAYARAAAQARKQLLVVIRERQLPGLAVAVMVNGQLVWHEAFGYADVAEGVPACPDTQFRAASLSKLFTASAMARLVESGRLDLDAPIQRYVPSFPVKSRSPITPRLLAEHRAGVRPYRDDGEAINLHDYPSVTASLAQFRNDSLSAEPGTRFIYSNYGHVLLSAAIEHSAGEDFLSCVKHQVFEPLGMNSTVEDRTGAILPKRAVFYDNVTPYSRDGLRVPSPPNNFSGRWASGGFLSTVDNLARFGSAFVAAGPHPFLSENTVHMLWRPRSGLPPLYGYGMGWMTARDLHGHEVHFHFGAGSGATAVLATWPRQRVTVSIMSNLGHARLPFNRLMSGVNPFLGCRTADRLAGVMAAAVMVLAFLRRRGWKLRPSREQKF